MNPVAVAVLYVANLRSNDVTVIDGAARARVQIAAPGVRGRILGRDRHVHLADRTEATMDLDAIRRRAEQATPGPWSRHGSDVRGPGAGEVLFAGRDGSAEIRRQADLDAEFVARAREDILVLLDALARESPAAVEG